MQQEPSGNPWLFLIGGLVLGLAIGGGGVYFTCGKSSGSSGGGGVTYEPESRSKPASGVNQSPLTHPPKDYSSQSVFLVENMIDASGKKKGPIPAVCVLDQSGELTSELKKKGATKSENWPCFYTELWCYKKGGQEIGFVACTVGASYAVLVASQLFACGCRLVIHFTQGAEVMPHPDGANAGSSFYVLVEKALRDEGTSLHYEPPAMWSQAPEDVLRKFPDAIFNSLKKKVYRGSSWTIDAPFRETQDAIDRAKALGILCVDMEASALMSYAKACGRPIVSFVKVENSNDDAEKVGDDDDGAADSLDLLQAASKAFLF